MHTGEKGKQQLGKWGREQCHKHNISKQKQWQKHFHPQIMNM